MAQLGEIYLYTSYNIKKKISFGIVGQIKSYWNRWN